MASRSDDSGKCVDIAVKDKADQVYLGEIAAKAFEEKPACEPQLYGADQASVQVAVLDITQR